MAEPKNTTCIAALFIATVYAITASASPEIPGAPQKQPIAIVGATVHPVSQPAIENATVLFDKGRIVAVGNDVELPDGTKTVQAEGKHVYPGLFNTDGNLGLIEINACLLYTSPSPRDKRQSRMPSSA